MFRWRLLLVIPLIGIAAWLGVAAHRYLAWRLVLEPAWAEPWRSVGLVTITLLGVSLLLAPWAERRLRPRWARRVTWPASLWMGLLFYSLLLLLAVDGALWLAGGAALAAADTFHGVQDLSRVRALGVGTVTLAAALAGLRGALRAPALRRVEHRLSGWPAALQGFRIVQISDLHIGPILDRRFAQRIVARCNALEPDLVAVTGDLIDGRVELLRDEVQPLAELRARHGVFFVTGNHDYISGADPWCERVRELGMRVLRNERVRIGTDDAGFDLAGVDDHHGGVLGGGGEDLDRALEGREGERPLLLLAHDPATFKQASKRGVDLQLSGHTHGGQLWPFVLFVRLVTPFVAGLYRRGASQLYVSRGTGFWGPPMRLFAPAEITEHVLLAADAPAPS